MPTSIPPSKREETEPDASGAITASRSLLDLVQVLQELHGKGIDLYLHRQGIDTTTPSGKAMFQMMGVFADMNGSWLGWQGQKPKGRS